LKIGTVVQTKENGLLVITDFENGQVKRFEKLEDYIADVVVVKFNDEYRTIKEVLDMCCEEYVVNNELIHFDETE
jgi:hypothetical protein